MSSTPQTPYTSDLENREPVSAMREAATRIGSLTANWTPAQFERSYAPGKWSARQILVHLAQSELALGNRARMALTTPDYQSQMFDQDRWMASEGESAAGGSNRSGASGSVARDALVAMSAFNCAYFESLAPTDRATPFTHPEYGALTIDWLLHQMAGHLIHHLKQIETIARS